MVTQGKAIRVVFKLQRNTNTDSMTEKHNVLNIKKLNLLQIGCYTYKDVHYIISENLPRYFTVNSINHTYLTRQSNNLHVTGCNLKMRADGIRFRVVNIWHILNISLANAPSFNLF